MGRPKKQHTEDDIMSVGGNDDVPYFEYDEDEDFLYPEYDEDSIENLFDDPDDIFEDDEGVNDYLDDLEDNCD